MTKFKVGDRVRLKRVNTYERWGAKGEEGTVIVADDGDDDCRVNFDVAGRWCASWDDLEVVAAAPAAATLAVEAGKFYKTRDGRKVGPMERYAEFGESGWQTVSRAGDFGGKLWINDGRRYFQSDRGGPTDLVAEWVDEPVASTPATTELAVNLDLEFIPFPQVGDDVLIFGTIAAINQSPRGTNYNIVFETQNRRMSLHFLEEDFIVVDDDDGGCTCASNNNGSVPSDDRAKAFDALGDWLRSLAVERAA